MARPTISCTAVDGSIGQPLAISLSCAQENSAAMPSPCALERARRLGIAIGTTVAPRCLSTSSAASAAART
eukprot:7241727-Prymnesium_polylepis.1